MSKIEVENKRYGKTIISQHQCLSMYQDKKYGVFRRVFNIGKKKGEVFCTVCGGKEVLA